MWMLWLHLIQEILSFQLLEQVDMNASEELNFGFFLSNTMDVISIGSGKLSSGVLVGVPYFFNYNKRDDVETERLKVSHTKIDWESPVAKDLIDSFVLSDCAKNYAILRQIYQGNTYGAYSSGVLGTILGYLSYVSGSALRHHYKLEYVLKTPARVMVYGMVAVVWACLYVTLKDMISCRRETIGDRFACNHGHGMWRGGLEYYNKQINRHKALRELMGGEGPGVYTAGGNYVQAAIRKPHLDITQRRDFIQRKMDNYEEFVKEHENVFKQLEENS